MAKVFDFDNPVWKFMGKLADMFFLNMLWLVFSVPIVTIGASTTALYYVMLKLAKDQEGNFVKAFLRSFKKNFMQATLMWLFLLAVGIVLVVNIYFCCQVQTIAAKMLLWIFLIFLTVYIFFITLLFPLMARLQNSLFKLCVIAFVTMIKQFSWVMLMVVITGCMVAMGVFVFWPVLLIGMGGIAYAHSKILVCTVFKKYNWNLPESDAG